MNWLPPLASDAPWHEYTVGRPMTALDGTQRSRARWHSIQVKRLPTGRIYGSDWLDLKIRGRQPRIGGCPGVADLVSRETSPRGQPATPRPSSLKPRNTQVGNSTAEHNHAPVFHVKHTRCGIRHHAESSGDSGATLFSKNGAKRRCWTFHVKRVDRDRGA